VLRALARLGLGGRGGLHALIDSIERVLSIAGLLSIEYPATVWASLDHRTANLRPGSTWPVPDSQDPEPNFDSAKERCTGLATGRHRDDLRARLLVANQELFGEYDRLEAESSFLLNIILPLFYPVILFHNSTL
jgi:hypothetical protein